jgi:flagellar biosynthesis protein FlhA
MSTKPAATASPLKGTEAIAPIAVLAVVLLMIVPLPPLLLDLLLSVDIGLSVVLLLTVIYVRQAVEFNVFPSLLLLLTLIRLSLNVAGTRLILMHGGDGVEAAGHVIMAFGQFVVGGNFVVGIVVFLVLIAIQFLVINHGAVRISEVTARFTLDALPGRQMAIDADLNAGMIDEKEARVRRDRVRKEADFYGAMDGAIRFTQRDSMAAILITFVNIVGGLIIGVFQQGLDLATAAETYTILTVGEGLVTAIPALLVSMSGGLITTRAATESNLGEEVAVQLLARARPLAVAATVLVGLALIPGLPKLSFLLVAALLGLGALATRQKADSVAAEPDAQEALPAEQSDTPALVDPLSIEIGYALVSLADDKQGGTLLNRLRAIRKQIASETGVVVPPVHVADNLQLGPRSYSILVKGVEVAKGDLVPDRLMAINPGTATAPLEGNATREPAFGLPAWWIPASQREHASAAGYTVVDPTTALSTHVSETIRGFLPDLLSRQQTKEMVDRLGQSAPKLVEELIPKVVSVGDIQRVLRQLLRERVPVRDLVTILEAIADAQQNPSKDPDALIEAVRQAMGRTICKQYQTDRGEIPAISLTPQLETRLMQALVRTEQGPVLALEPNQAQAMASKIADALASAMAQPVLLCTPMLRPHLWRLFTRVLPHIGVLSHNEIPAQLRIATVAVLD